MPSCLRPTLSAHWNRIEHWAKARHFVARLVDSTRALHPVHPRSVDLNSGGVPGVPCWSFGSLIGFPLRSVLEPVCGAELFALHSISPLEPD